MKAVLDKYFLISARNSTIKTEIVAGLTTFAAMSYILAVNPIILSSTGMDRVGLVTVTALAAFFGSVFMGLFAKLPIGVAPAMGTNSYFALIICAGMGVPWQGALSLTFYNGLLFLLISLLGIREKIIKAVPAPLQVGLQCGIGLFIAFMGLQHSGLIIGNPATLVSIGNLVSAKSIICILGFIFMAYLIAKRVQSGIILTILAITFICFFIPDADGKNLATFPSKILSLPASISQTFFAIDFAWPFKDLKASLPIIFTLLLLDMFDTIGSVIALGRRTGMMNQKGEMKGIGRTLVVDSSATILGSFLGTSTVTAYVESAAGIEAGGRTGLAALTTGLLFLCALFFNPIISAAPEISTAPVLILVGIMMTSGMSNLNFKDLSETIPAMFCMLMIMLTFSITQGFAFGVLMYVVMMIASKRTRKITSGTWILFAVMIAFIFGAAK